jgi:iron complex transport system permease protein
MGFNWIERMSSKSPLTLIALALFLVAAIILATGMGFLAIAPLEVIQVLWAKARGVGMAADINPTFPFVIMEVRLPRILAAAIVGGGLAVAGAVFQAILLNPLADP